MALKSFRHVTPQQTTHFEALSTLERRQVQNPLKETLG